MWQQMMNEPNADARFWQLAGGGATGALIREKDWSTTPLGPIECWPAALRSVVQMVVSSPVPMTVLWGGDGVLIYNDGYAEVCGPRHPEALGGKLLEVWPEARDFNARVIAAAMAGDALSFREQELELWRKGRPEKVWMDLEYTPLRDAAGLPAGMLAMVFDITPRVLAEAQLVESEERYRFLDDLGQAVGALHDADEVMQVTTRMVATHLGLSNCAYADMDGDEDGFTIRGDWHAPTSRSIVGHYSLADFGTLAVGELRAGRPLIINNNLAEIAAHEAKTFQDIGIAATICMPLIKNGRLTALMAINDSVPRAWSERELTLIRDVTMRSWAHVERVAAEANLRSSEEQLRLAVEAAEVGLWDVDEVRGTMFWPARVKAMFGISPDVPVSMDDYYAGLHPDDYEATAAAYAAAANPSRRAIYDVEYRTIGKEDGLERWVAAKGRGIFEDDRCVRVIGTAIDITAWKRTEQALRDLNDTLEQRIEAGIAERKILADVVENTTAIIFVADPEFRWRAINKAAAAAFKAIYGIRPTIGASMLDALAHLPEHREQVSRIWGRALAGEEFSLTEEFGDPGHARRTYEMTFSALRDPSGRRVGAYQIVHDVTERVAEQRRLAEAEELLRQAQKVEALGRLTGGVAHDFNNLLTPIIGSLDLLTRKEVGNERERKLIEGALQSAERARTLVQRLLAFARRQPLQPMPIDIRTLIQGMSELVSTTTGPQVPVVVHAPDDLPLAQADFNQVEMAVLNLCVNARDAMPNGGTIRITASSRTIKRDQADLRAGAYVLISVADTGTGMDAATLARAIEPFFSTKGVGRGTGLGLSMVHGLAQQLGGGMRLFSREGVGTNVELWLPVATKISDEQSATKPSGVLTTPRKGRALVVDDEAVVRAATAHMMSEIGYEVVEAEDAAEALRFLRSNTEFSILVSDHLMPGMNGVELVRVARSLHPHLRCLIVSGYADVEGIAPDFARLAKPFRVDELAAALDGMDS